VASAEPLHVQQQGKGVARDMPAEHVQPGAAAWGSSTAEPQSNGRLRPSLEELEEGMPDAATIDEETREDKFLERASAGAVRWCDANSIALCWNHARLDAAISHPLD
jgi:hypothetical protein